MQQLAIEGGACSKISVETTSTEKTVTKRCWVTCVVLYHVPRDTVEPHCIVNASTNETDFFVFIAIDCFMIAFNMFLYISFTALSNWQLS